MNNKIIINLINMIINFIIIIFKCDNKNKCYKIIIKYYILYKYYYLPILGPTRNFLATRSSIFTNK